MWVIGHEVGIDIVSSPQYVQNSCEQCGHGAFSRYDIICDVLGYIIHTALWTPYFSWKIVHHRHHANHASMERDEVLVESFMLIMLKHAGQTFYRYVPKTRADLGLPSRDDDSPVDYSEYFSDTPLWTLLLLIFQQLFAFPAYLLYNASGQKDYPKWTNHFNRKLYLSLRRRSYVI